MEFDFSNMPVIDLQRALQAADDVQDGNFEVFLGTMIPLVAKYSDQSLKTIQQMPAPQFAIAIEDFFREFIAQQPWEFGLDDIWTEEDNEDE